MDELKLFEKYLTDQDLARATVNGYMMDMEHFARWFKQTNGEELIPERLTPTDVHQYKQFLLIVQRCKASTINRHLAALSAYIKWARAAGLILSDPTENVKLVEQVDAGPKWLDKNEQFALQRSIERDLQSSKMHYPKRWVTRRRDASLVLVLLYTGLRLSELTAMHLGDIRLSERKGSVLVQDGKGTKQRQIPLHLNARKALEEWLAVRPANGSDFLWIAVEADSNGLSGRAIQRILNRYAKESGLDGLTPHMCRHTFAKNLVNQDVGLEKIGALLGHSSLNTTRRYIMPGERDLETAIGELA